jgi:leader peptidase (prepilin peptidase)/N-methyltransferase
MERSRPAHPTISTAAAGPPGLAGDMLLAPAARRWALGGAATAVLWATAVVAADDLVAVALGIVLVTALVPIVGIDIAHRRIPNAVTLPATGAALVAGTLLDPAGELGRIAAAAGAAVFLLIPALLHPQGMGIGDVKLAGVLGLCLGPAVAVALLVALLAGTAFGLVLAVRSGVRAARSATIPFGPYLALGGVVGLVAGPQLLDGYLTLR